MGYDDLEGADPGMRPYLRPSATPTRRCARAAWTGPSSSRGGSPTSPGPGRIDAARKLGRSGEIPRDDVALTILECLQAPNTIRKEFEELSGDTPVGEAVRRALALGERGELLSPAARGTGLAVRHQQRVELDARRRAARKRRGGRR